MLCKGKIKLVGDDLGDMFKPNDLRVMRSYIDVAPVINVLDRTGVVIAKPSVSPYGVSKKRKVKIHFNQ